MSQSRIRPFLPVAVAFLALAAIPALAQNADQNSAGPTKNDLRLRVVEPAEGSTVVGSTVHVTISNSLPRTTQESGGTTNMPNPSFRIYLDNTLKGEIKRDDNVMTIESVPAGSQKLVVEALNPSGEVIDRKEVRFQTVAAASAAPPSAIPSSAGNPRAASVVPPEPPPPAAASAPVAAPRPPAMKTLPKTASTAPRAILAGLVLILAGLLVSRKPGV